MKIFTLNIGTYIAIGYLILVFITVWELGAKSTDGLGALAVVVFTAPGSILLAYVVAYCIPETVKNNPIFFLQCMLVFGGLLNAIVIHLFGAAVKFLYVKLSKSRLS